MAVTFTNNFKNILDKLESILETEFKGALPVYKGNTVPKGANQALQLIPTGSVSVRFIFNEANIRETALDHVLRYVSRIEALIHDNVAMTLSDSTSAFNCRLESTELNTDEESNVYVVEWDYKCQHLGNVG